MEMRSCPKCNAQVPLVCVNWLEPYMSHGQHVVCPSCITNLVICYDEQCTEDYSDCWDMIYLEVSQ